VGTGVLVGVGGDVAVGVEVDVSVGVDVKLGEDVTVSVGVSVGTEVSVSVGSLVEIGDGSRRAASAPQWRLARLDAKNKRARAIDLLKRRRARGMGRILAQNAAISSIWTE
jgi:hypothetical protein